MRARLNRALARGYFFTRRAAHPCSSPAAAPPATKAATTAGCEMMNQSVIEVGAFADVIAVDGDPDRDFTSINRVKFVMKGGTVYVGRP